MSYVIELPRPIEERIEEEAQKSGLTAAALLTELVRKSFGIGADTEEAKRLNAPGKQPPKWLWH